VEPIHHKDKGILSKGGSNIRRLAHGAWRDGVGRKKEKTTKTGDVYWLMRKAASARGKTRLIEGVVRPTLPTKKKTPDTGEKNWGKAS